MYYWWRKSEAETDKRLEQFMHVEIDPNTDEVAVFRLANNSCISMSMHELSQLHEYHKDRIAHPLTPPSDKAWMRHESDLALAGARVLQARYKMPLPSTFINTREPEVNLSGAAAKNYAGLIQRLTSAKPAP